MAGGNFLNRLVSALTNARVPAKPYAEQGVSGFSAYGGYVVTPETNAELLGQNRWHTAADILTNISIIAASVRYSLNLISRPAWRADPPSDKPEAKAMAEFVEEVINGADTGWSRIIRRSALYRYHGFNLQEWVAKKRDDGKIGLQAVDPRPVHTIRKWDIDENGGIQGVIQCSPQTGQELYLPRAKLVYLVDDALTDRPEGMGWFRHLADPAQRLRRYLKLETMGFERDLAGIPVGRAPLQRINELVASGKLDQKQATKMIDAMDAFVRMQAKEPTTGLVFDSEPFINKGGDGSQTVSNVMQWGMELLTGNAASAAALGEAIHRLMMDMALIVGTDSMLIGGRGEGSRALSEDKSKNLYLTANAALVDMAEAYDRDIVTPIWAMNGFDDDLRPKLKTEDVSFKDAASIAQALADMAAAGAILHPNDPAINDLRDLMGVSAAPPVDEATAALMLGAKAGITQGGGDDPNEGGGGGGKPSGGRPSRENPASTSGEVPSQKFDPSEPRDEYGRWTDGGIPLTRDLKQQLVSPNVGKTVGKMRSEAKVNQKALDEIGAHLEERGVASYEPPPKGYEVKSPDSVMRKLRDEGYAGPHEITDYSRASFVIDHPHEAGGVIKSLGERGTVYDKGWQYIERTGYLDRKVYLQHPNGGLSEIQITPRGVFQVKMGQGHRLYEVARLRSTPKEVASATMRRSRNLYAKVISRTPFARLANRSIAV